MLKSLLRFHEWNEESNRVFSLHTNLWMGIRGARMPIRPKCLLFSILEKAHLWNFYSLSSILHWSLFQTSIMIHIFFPTTTDVNIIKCQNYTVWIDYYISFQHTCNSPKHISISTFLYPIQKWQKNSIPCGFFLSPSSSSIKINYSGKKRWYLLLFPNELSLGFMLTLLVLVTNIKKLPSEHWNYTCLESLCWECH